ncbi:MAG: LysR family transcriptional regulator [Pseudomonadota bacterium]
MTKIERLALNSDLLRAFVAIAENGHLTLAAKRLNRTQSAVSVQLRKIETALNTRLFQRHAKGMTLTSDGEKLLPIARDILADMYRAQALFEEPLRGTIRIGIPDHYDDMVFEVVLAEFGRAYPEVDIFVTSGCSSGYATAILKGDLDIAVLSGREHAGGELLETEATHWVEGERFETDPEKPIPLAVLDRGCWWSKLPVTALSQQGRVFNIAFKSESFSNLRCAIRAGLAIGVLPARAIQDGMRTAPANRRLPPLPALARTLMVSQQAPADIARAVTEALKAGLAAHPG